MNPMLILVGVLILIWILSVNGKDEENKLMELEAAALKARNETDKALAVAEEKARLEAVAASKVVAKLNCKSGMDDVNGTCLTKMVKYADGNYAGGGLVVRKSLSGWSTDRWMLDGDTRMGLLYSNKGAITPGDITEWRTTNNSITHGDRIVPGFRLMKHGSGYYLHGNYRVLLDIGRGMHKKG
jgi:hypothetical protein